MGSRRISGRVHRALAIRRCQRAVLRAGVVYHQSMLVDVYRNLHRAVWSVRSVETGRVILHTARVELRDVVCRVSEAQRQRVLMEGRRNVHAVVRGELVDHGGRSTRGRRGPARRSRSTWAPIGWIRVRYDPLRSPYFAAGDPRSPRRQWRVVVAADRAMFDAHGAAWMVAPVLEPMPDLVAADLAPVLRGLLRRGVRAVARAAA